MSHTNYRRLDKTNKAVRDVLSKELHNVIVERSRGNGAGVHVNKGERRARTRSTAIAKAIREWA
jgi:hypothetical protein